MSKNLNDTAGVDAYLMKLDPAFADTIQILRRIILDTDSDIGEYIKWNSPSFFYTGPMPPFDPKEYKRDLIVLNLHRNKIRLVFPTGACITDETGLLEGTYTDGRRLVTFTDTEDILAKQSTLQTVIKNWLAQIER